MPEMAVLYDKIHTLDRRLSVLANVIENMETARSLQAKEYERRLDFLNGEAERLREMQAEYLPREVWNNVSSDIMAQIRELKQYRDTSIGRQAIIATIIPVIISLLFLWLSKR